MNLEDRKIKEIEHSRQRREILQGYERFADTHAAQQAGNLEDLIKDKEAFKKYFANMKYYAITAESDQYQKNWIAAKSSKDKKILDFACGNGENGIYAALCGADCIGIDISPEGVANSNKNAETAGVADHCRFEVMDGENMAFADNTFDLGVEYGALHHVDLDAAMAELARVLKPGAEMICIEALRHNPLIHWYRKRTPHLRTEWEVEHILGVESLEVIGKYFDKVEAKFFHLASLAAVPFRKTFIFKPLLSFLNSIDNFILGNKAIGKYAWIMVIEISNPKK
jgi:ubiquinone/menaquinone biosynthesis C-methylase UbiE